MQHTKKRNGASALCKNHCFSTYFEIFFECQKRSFGILCKSYLFPHPETFPGSGQARHCQKSQVPKCGVTGLTWEWVISDTKEGRNIWDIQKQKIIYSFFPFSSSPKRNSHQVLMEVPSSDSGSDQVLPLYSSHCTSWWWRATAVLTVLKPTLYST